MSNSIEIKYDGNKITFYVNGQPKGDSSYLNYAEYDMNKPNIQKKLRYLDSKKDLLGLTGFDDVIKRAYGIPTTDNTQYSELKKIKNTYIQESYNNGSIVTKSWAKTKTRDSLNIQLKKHNNEKTYMFREVGLNLKDDIIDDTGNKIIPIDISCFSNTILDPFIRSFKYSSTEHFPEINQELIFDKSFLNFLGFLKCNTVSSKLFNQVSLPNDLVVYNYEYLIGYDEWLKIPIQGTIMYPNDPNKSNQGANPIEKYVIGNENKKSIVSSFTGKSNNYKELIVQIKEMGDVLQVYSMLAWMKTNNIDSKSFFMSSNDSIVFLMCITLGLPCILLEFKDENEDIPSPAIPVGEKKLNGRTRYFQRFMPANFTLEEKIDQLKNEIINSNNKIKNIIKFLMDNKNQVFISKTESIIIAPDFLNKIIGLIDVINAKIIIIDQTNVITQGNFNEIEKIVRQNFIFNEIFYYKNGKYFASTFVNFFTTNKGNISKGDDPELCFPCKDTTFNSGDHDPRGKQNFSLLCQKHRIINGGFNFNIIDINDLSISNEIINNEENIIVEPYHLHLYKILFNDIYDLVIQYFSKKFNYNLTNLDSYFLYDLYISLSNDFFQYNEVFYPENKQTNLPEVYKNSFYLDSFVDDYLNNYVIDEKSFKKFINNNNVNINSKEETINETVDDLFFDNITNNNKKTFYKHSNKNNTKKTKSLNPNIEKTQKKQTLKRSEEIARKRGIKIGGKRNKTKKQKLV